MTELLNSLPPGSPLMLGALLAPLFRGRALVAWILLLPVSSFLHMLSLPSDHLLTVGLFDFTITPIRVDRLALIFGWVFHIAALLSALYAAHVKDPLQHVSGLVYAGAAIAAVFAGDLVSLFFSWELTALASVFLIWANSAEIERTQATYESFAGAMEPGARAARLAAMRASIYRTGMRYLVIQVGSGVLLLAGMILHVQAGGSLEFTKQALLGVERWSTGLDWRSFPPGAQLILLAFGIKAAFPLLHNWLQDGYPKATATGTVFLSAFTTKLAIYALCRAFSGTEVLIAVGCVMTIFPIFFAVVENDLRKVLAYSLNNQLGFMVVGVGVGTQLAINGAAAHAFAHIIYKGLLFMSMGAVLYRVGTTKASELGGLHKSMPWTTLSCIIGAMSISAFPLMSGFTTKSMTISAVSHEHLLWAWLALTFASAGVMEHSGIKIPFFAFFAHDSGKRPEEAPWNMLAAMAIAAGLCVFIGVYPAPLYTLLPTQMDYSAYGATHVITQLQLLFWALLAFGFLYRRGWYPAELPGLNLDFDWIYRRLLPRASEALLRWGSWGRGLAESRLSYLGGKLFERIYRTSGPRGVLADTWPTGSIALWAALLLGGYLILYSI